MGIGAGGIEVDRIGPGDSREEACGNGCIPFVIHLDGKGGVHG